MAIQAQAYRSIAPEPLATLKSKWEHSPQSCFAYAHHGEITAYLLAHSWNSHEPPKLYAPVDKNIAGDILFLHDLAIMRESAKRGIGTQLVKHLLDYAQAQGFARVLLVAIQDSCTYWEKFGFTLQEHPPANETYGTGAMVMVKILNK